MVRRRDGRRAGWLALGCGIAAIALPLAAAPPSADLAFANRMSWGITPALADEVAREGSARWFDAQLRMPLDTPLPPAIQQQIDAMRISQESMMSFAVEADRQAVAIRAMTDPDQKTAATKARVVMLSQLNREAQTRSLLRDLYSPAQLREQMTWFWYNHFNVQSTKADIHSMVGDYEEKAIRPHALGRFRDLLEATLHHPAMLRYLDNSQNAANHINENYAREIMELHSMGVGSGYTQKDVQELARILTGVGIDLAPTDPKLKPEWQPLYIRDGMFEFNPARHDFGPKTFLGHPIAGQGFAEVEQALDLIAKSPATAHHVSQKMAMFFMGDKPPAALVDRMAATFQRSDGDTIAVLRTMAQSPEFRASLVQAQTFKDPVHYVVSATRLSFGDRTILNADPMIAWLARMGEGLYARETPDGYPLTTASWTGPGQLGVRFEVARQIASGANRLFLPGEIAQPLPRPILPQLQGPLFAAYFAGQLAPTTRAALDQSGDQLGWNSLFLSSPEFMRR